MRPFKIFLLFILGTVLCYGIFIYSILYTPLALFTPSNVVYKILVIKSAYGEECGFKCYFNALSILGKEFIKQGGDIAQVLDDSSRSVDDKIAFLSRYTAGLSIETIALPLLSKEDIDSLYKMAGNSQESVALRKQALEILSGITKSGDEQKEERLITLEAAIIEEKEADADLRKMALTDIKERNKILPQVIPAFAEAMGNHSLCLLGQEALRSIEGEENILELLGVAANKKYSSLARKEALIAIQGIAEQYLEENDTFLFSQIDSEVRRKIREILLALLDHPHYGIRAMAGDTLEAISGEAHNIEPGSMEELQESCAKQFIDSIDTNEIEVTEEELQEIIAKNREALAEPTEQEKIWQAEAAERAKQAEKRKEEEMQERIRIIKDKDENINIRMAYLLQLSDRYNWRSEEENDTLFEFLLNKSQNFQLRMAVIYILWPSDHVFPDEWLDRVKSALDIIINDPEENWDVQQAAIIRREASHFIYYALVRDFRWNIDEEIYNYTPYYQNVSTENIFNIEQAIKGMQEEVLDKIPPGEVPERVKTVEEFIKTLKQYSEQHNE